MRQTGRCIVCACVLLFSAPAFGQSSVVEVFGGASIWKAFQESIYDAPYTPADVDTYPFFSGNDLRNAASQSLALNAGTSLALGTGVNVFLHHTWGFQFLFDYSGVALSGTNVPHQVEFTYLSIQPPSYIGVERTNAWSFPVSDTIGEMDQRTFSMNGVVRFAEESSIAGSVSAGLSYTRVRLEAEPLAAAGAWTGGHGVIFVDLSEFSVLSDSAHSLGVNLGGTIDISVGPSLTLFADARLFRVGRPTPTLQPDRLISDSFFNNGESDSIILSRITNHVALQPAEIEPSYARLLVGIKWSLR